MAFTLVRKLIQRMRRARLPALTDVADESEHDEASLTGGELDDAPDVEAPTATSPESPDDGSAAPNDAAEQQTQILQDMYSLMSGQGINVNVQNFDQIARFTS